MNSERTSFLIVEVPRGFEIHVDGKPCGIVLHDGTCAPQDYVSGEHPYTLSIDDRARATKYKTGKELLGKMSGVLAVLHEFVEEKEST